MHNDLIHDCQAEAAGSLRFHRRESHKSSSTGLSTGLSDPDCTYLNKLRQNVVRIPSVALENMPQTSDFEVVRA